MGQGRRVYAERWIDAPPDAVWRQLADIGSHATWMADAIAVRFTTEQRAGVGTVFEADTKVGPFALVDVMEVTEWVDRERIAVRHRGIVTGEGAFSIAPAGRGTAVRWDETLRFPWWIGGRAGGVVAARVLAAIWRGNLRRLASVVRRDGAGGGP